MDFSAKLEELQAKTNETVATARAAAAEDRDQLKQRVEKAQDDAKQVMQDSRLTTWATEPRASGPK